MPAMRKKRASLRSAVIACMAARLKCCPAPSPITVPSRRPLRCHLESFRRSTAVPMENWQPTNSSPQMLTSLFDAEQRSKRQLVKYDEIPKVMVDAVTSIEDRRFFQHNGVNFMRLAEAAWIDFTHQRHQQGGSTITMQLSRAFFLSPEKTFKRKLIEMLIAVELEQKFSKQQIFEFYANRVDLGQRGSFTISGLAEGSQSYFNKDLKDITLPEAALLAGLIQAPSYSFAVPPSRARARTAQYCDRGHGRNPRHHARASR